MGPPPPQALGRETVLRICLALDDGALAWVYEALFVERKSVMEKFVKVESKELPIKDDPSQPSGALASGALALEEKASEAQPTADLDTLPAGSPEPKADSRAFEAPAPREPTAELDALEPKADSRALLPEPAEASPVTYAAAQENHRLSLSVDFSDLASAVDSGTLDHLHELFVNRDKKTHGDPPADMVPRIQFWTSMCYCNEEEPTVDIAVVRIGDVSRRSCTEYRTRDISAKAGKKYTAVSGTVVFEKGERLKYLQVSALNDDTWDATLEFEMVLDGKQDNAVLAAAGSTCRIKIIDDDCFPTNKYKELINAGRIHEVSTPFLLLEYFKMNLTSPIVKRGLIKTCIADQVENIYYMVCLFMDLWLVDYVLCDDCDKEAASGRLQIVILLRVLPYGLVHWLQYKATGWKVGGTSRMTLQANLLRKYLSYDECSLAQIDESKLIMAMTRDAFDLVQNAFCKLHLLIAALSRLLMLLLYQIFVPMILGEEMGTSTDIIVRFMPLFVFPIAMIFFLYLRNPRTLFYLEKQKRLENEMLFHIKRTVGSFELIRDYRKRGMYVDIFEKKIKLFNSSFTASSGILVNNAKFASWCSLLVVAAYTQFGGMQVAGGRPVGAFLNNVAVYSTLGDVWGQVYEVLLEMQQVTDALTTVVEYMNLPTEHQQVEAQYRRNSSIVQSEFEAAVEAHKWAGCDPVDQTCIELRNLSFAYKSKGLITSKLQPSSAKFVQGGLYALVGPPSEGKGTILKLLGEVLIPFFPGFMRNCEGGGGDLVIPTHLSTLHVAKDPSFVEGSLFYNLTFGCADENECDMARVIAICKKLGIGDYILETIKDTKMEGCDWLKLLSSTECALLHVARALVTNPEVMMIHKPALCLNTDMSNNMYAVLKEFVTNRGLEEDPKEFFNRRPRTCIISARRVEGPAAECSDAVYHVSQAMGLQLVKDHRRVADDFEKGLIRQMS